MLRRRTRQALDRPACLDWTCHVNSLVPISQRMHGGTILLAVSFALFVPGLIRASIVLPEGICTSSLIECDNADDRSCSNSSEFETQRHLPAKQTKRDEITWNSEQAMETGPTQSPSGSGTGIAVWSPTTRVPVASQGLTWVLAEDGLYLPSSPGIDLLRPPQR